MNDVSDAVSIKDLCLSWQEYPVPEVEKGRTFYVVLEHPYEGFDGGYTFRQIVQIAASEDCSKIAVLAFKPSDRYSSKEREDIAFFFQLHSKPLALCCGKNSAPALKAFCGYSKDFRDSYWNYSNTKDWLGKAEIVSLLNPLIIFYFDSGGKLLIDGDEPMNEFNSFASHFITTKQWR